MHCTTRSKHSFSRACLIVSLFAAVGLGSSAWGADDDGGGTSSGPLSALGNVLQGIHNVAQDIDSKIGGGDGDANSDSADSGDDQGSDDSSINVPSGGNMGSGSGGGNTGSDGQGWHHHHFDRASAERARYQEHQRFEAMQRQRFESRRQRYQSGQRYNAQQRNNTAMAQRHSFRGGWQNARGTPLRQGAMHRQFAMNRSFTPRTVQKKH